MNSITAHVIVRNEQRWVWFAIKSIVDFVDRVIVFDMGSTDKTVDVIRQIDSPKIEIYEKGFVSVNDFPKYRQEQLDMTNSGWVFVLDGDEIWPFAAIEALCRFIREDNNKDVDIIAVPFTQLVLDLYHAIAERKGRYGFAGRQGFITVKAFRKSIPGLHCGLRYGIEGYFNSSGVAIQHIQGKLQFFERGFLHTSLLPRGRSMLDDVRIFYRLRKWFSPMGRRVQGDFDYPEVLYGSYPAMVPDPWRKAPLVERVIKNSFALVVEVRRGYRTLRSHLKKAPSVEAL